MGEVLPFPGNPQSSDVNASPQPIEDGEAQALPPGITDYVSPDEAEIFEGMSAEERLAFVKLEEMLAHIKSLDVITAPETRAMIADVVSGYSREEMVSLMGQSTQQDWLRHSAFYRALAKNLALHMLGSVAAKEKPESGLRLV